MSINGLNEACKNIEASYLKVVNESMSAILFWKTAKGGLFHLYYIFRRTEPLGTELENVDCSVTGDFIFIELQRGKEGTNHRNFYHQLGATAACTYITTEATKGIGQRDTKGSTKDWGIH